MASMFDRAIYLRSPRRRTIWSHRHGTVVGSDWKRSEVAGGEKNGRQLSAQPHPAVVVVVGGAGGSFCFPSFFTVRRKNSGRTPSRCWSVKWAFQGEKEKLHQRSGIMMLDRGGSGMSWLHRERFCVCVCVCLYVYLTLPNKRCEEQGCFCGDLGVNAIRRRRRSKRSIG